MAFLIALVSFAVLLILASTWVIIKAPHGVSSHGRVQAVFSRDHRVMAVQTLDPGKNDEYERLFIDTHTGRVIDFSIDKKAEILALGREGILHVGQIVRYESSENRRGPFTIEYRKYDLFANRRLQTSQFESPNGYIHWMSTRYAIEQLDDRLRVIDLQNRHGGFEFVIPSKNAYVRQLGESFQATSEPRFLIGSEVDGGENNTLYKLTESGQVVEIESWLSTYQQCVIDHQIVSVTPDQSRVEYRDLETGQLRTSIPNPYAEFGEHRNHFIDGLVHNDDPKDDVAFDLRLKHQVRFTNSNSRCVSRDSKRHREIHVDDAFEKLIFNRRISARIIDRVDSSVIARFSPYHYARTEFESADSVISVSTRHFVQVERYDAKSGKQTQSLTPYRWISILFYCLIFGWLVWGYFWNSYSLKHNYPPWLGSSIYVFLMLGFICFRSRVVSSPWPGDGIHLNFLAGHIAAAATGCVLWACCGSKRISTRVAIASVVVCALIALLSFCCRDSSTQFWSYCVCLMAPALASVVLIIGIPLRGIQEMSFDPSGGKSISEQHNRVTFRQNWTIREVLLLTLAFSFLFFALHRHVAAFDANFRLGSWLGASLISVVGAVLLFSTKRGFYGATALVGVAFAMVLWRCFHAFAFHPYDPLFTPLRDGKASWVPAIAFYWLSLYFILVPIYWAGWRLRARFHVYSAADAHSPGENQLLSRLSQPIS